MAEEKKLSDFPLVLIDVVRSYEASGAFLCAASALTIAELWRGLFGLPLPLGMNEASAFVQDLKGIQVLLQPRLEVSMRFSVRGIWVEFNGRCFVLIDAERPNPSRIRTLIHELSEKLLHISHLLHPDIPERTSKAREQWATEVAVYVKMPPEKFCAQVAQVNLDIEVLKDENDETLGCVARHLKNWIMSTNVYYWCRFDLAPYGLKKDAGLARVAASLGGACIRVVDVVRSPLVDISRRQVGGLPDYNLPAFYHYRILNPAMNKFIMANKPVLFEELVGGASDEYFFRDLFGEYNLCVLLVPYGRRQTKGFWMIAVHPRDRFRLSHALDRIQPEERGSIEWMFSHYSYTHKSESGPLPQKELAGLGDAPSDLEGLFAKQFEREPYL